MVAIDAPELFLRGISAPLVREIWWRPNRRQLRRLRVHAREPVALRADARLLGVRDVLLEKIERGPTGPHRVRDIARLHHEVLDIRPMLPPEVQYSRDHAVEGPHQGLVLLAGLTAHRPRQQDPLPDAHRAPHLGQEFPMSRGHGELELPQSVPELLRRHLDAARCVDGRQQRAHRPRGPGQGAGRGRRGTVASAVLRHVLGVSIESQWPGLDQRPQDLVENVFAAFRCAGLVTLVHDWQTSPHHAPHGLLEEHQLVQQLVVVVRRARRNDRRDGVRGL
mmetsp:Transcript_79683/g.207786  ORF Transcript_79683/g.207786 Transcript_79683/m.207786 type:complete len:279 (-) Transcript_79683:737-1573(-)